LSLPLLSLSLLLRSAAAICTALGPARGASAAALARSLAARPRMVAQCLASR
jgi:hypothetical protein